MSMRPHIAIIGAGLIGLCAADQLLLKGARVTVIDSRAGPGLGASFSNSGMLHPSQSLAWRPGASTQTARHVVELAARSKILTLEKMKTLGLPDFRREAGCVQIFTAAEDLQRRREIYREMGIDAQDIQGREQAFGWPALYFPGDMSGDAYSFCRALAADIARRGADIFYGQAEIPKADHVVIAAGMGSIDVAKTYSLDLPLYPELGHALNFAKPDMALPSVPVMDFASRSALTIFEDHLRLSGTTGETSPDSLRRIWQEIAPDLMAALGAPLNLWTAERPMCDLGRPVIARVGAANGAKIWVNAGHGHMGWSLCMGSGALLADMIMAGGKYPYFAL